MRQKNRILLAFASLSLVSLCLTACSGGVEESGSKDSSGQKQEKTPLSTQVPGTWGDPTTQGTTSLEFFAEGRFTGTDGCNRVNGSWTDEGEKVIFGPIMSTRMACEGVDTWFERAASARVEGSQLVIADLNGLTIGSLDKGH